MLVLTKAPLQTWTLHRYEQPLCLISLSYFLTLEMVPKQTSERKHEVSKPRTPEHMFGFLLVSLQRSRKSLSANTLEYLYVFHNKPKCSCLGLLTFCWLNLWCKSSNCHWFWGERSPVWPEYKAISALFVSQIFWLLLQVKEQYSILLNPWGVFP